MIVMHYLSMWNENGRQNKAITNEMRFGYLCIYISRMRPCFDRILYYILCELHSIKLCADEVKQDELNTQTRN